MIIKPTKTCFKASHVCNKTHFCISSTLTPVTREHKIYFPDSLSLLFLSLNDISFTHFLLSSSILFWRKQNYIFIFCYLFLMSFSNVWNIAHFSFWAVITCFSFPFDDLNTYFLYHRRNMKSFFTYMLYNFLALLEKNIE